MLLSELQEKYPLVFERLMNQTNFTIPQMYQIGLDSIDVNGALAWNETQEGGKFWERVHRYDIEEAKRLCPDLFIPVGVEEPPYKIVTNGLFKN